MPKFIVFGAGCVGVYIGSVLLASGQNVLFVSRSRLQSSLAASDTGKLVVESPKGRLSFEIADIRVIPRLTLDDIEDGDSIILAVKSNDTLSSLQQIGPLLHGKKDIAIISAQNGVENAELIQKELSGHDFVLINTIFGSNVIWRDPFQQPDNPTGDVLFKVTTSNPAVVERTESGREMPLYEALVMSGSDWSPPFVCTLTTDIRNAQMGKLLINLHNAISALTDLPLCQELQNFHCRRVWALCFKEGLAVMRAKGYNPNLIGFRPQPPPISVMPWVLSTPNWMGLHSQSAGLDPLARSSMWDDLSSGRTTEIQELNGFVQRLGRSLSIPTPFSDRIIQIVESQHGRPYQPIDPKKLYEMVLDGKKDSGIEMLVFNAITIGAPLTICGLLALASSFLIE